ncbi:hypothetical protein ABKV90_09630 [Enterobacter hormaechei]
MKAISFTEAKDIIGGALTRSLVWLKVHSWVTTPAQASWAWLAVWLAEFWVAQWASWARWLVATTNSR